MGELFPSNLSFGYCGSVTGAWQPLTFSATTASLSLYDELAIEKIVVQDEKAVIVFFKDGYKAIAVVHEGDTFDLETGLTICLVKKLLAKNHDNADQAFHSYIRKALKYLEDEKKEKEQVELDKKARIEVEAKRQAKIKARKEKRREEEIEIKKEAYLRAMKEAKEV